MKGEGGRREKGEKGFPSAPPSLSPLPLSTPPRRGDLLGPPDTPEPLPWEKRGVFYDSTVRELRKDPRAMVPA